MCIVVLGYLIRGPLGGLSWHHLQYVLGLKQSGHQVLFLEDSDNYVSCYDPTIDGMTADPTFGINFINHLFGQYDLQQNWAYYNEHTNKWFGLSQSAVFAFCNKADAVLNLSNVNPLRSWWEKIPVRILVDTDPAFTQMRNLEEEISMKIAERHTHYFSFGENFGKLGCKIPDDGFNWQPTRQPVYLPAWKVQAAPSVSKWTTVMQWDSYKVRRYKELTFGMKSLSFNEFEDLPSKMRNENFELALGSATAPVEELKTKGWNIVSSLVPAKTPWTYQEYIHASKGEWSVAKHGYVISNSGWFSERSTCYLASGKPVVVQETGFSKIMETGKGLFSFQTVEQAIESINEINKDYSYHCAAARKFVEENFDARKVLKDLLDKIF